MLEGLDQVDWASLTHYDNKSAIDVPELIRRISQYDTKAMLELFGDDNPPGYYIEFVTPHIIPFMLEMIAEGEEKVRGAILDTLGRLINACEFGLNSEAEDYIYITRFEYAKLCLRTYEEISKGISLYQNSLSHDTNRRAKFEAADLLSHFTEYGTAIADFFCEQVKNETDDTVIACILYNMVVLITHTPEFRNDGVSKREKYLVFLVELIAENKNEIITVAAALCAVYIARERIDYHPLDLPNVVILVLQKELKRLFAGGELLPVRGIPYGKGYIAEYLVKASIDDLFAFLKSNDFTFRDTHTVIYNLMNVHFRNRIGAPYGKWIFIHEQKRILEFLVEYDKFWETPSDLLSSLYSLPDSREELRKVIAEGFG